MEQRVIPFQKLSQKYIYIKINKNLALQELNLRGEDNPKLLTIPNYTLVHDSLLKCRVVARAGLLIHNSINYKYRQDLSSQEEAHVAITVYITKTKNLTYIHYIGNGRYNKSTKTHGTTEMENGEDTIAPIMDQSMAW